MVGKDLNGTIKWRVESKRDVREGILGGTDKIKGYLRGSIETK